MTDDTAEIGIFGGTGIYDSELLQDSKEITIETPYGKTSDTITIGEFEGKKNCVHAKTWKKTFHTSTFDKLLRKYLGLQGIRNYKNNFSNGCW